MQQTWQDLEEDEDNNADEYSTGEEDTTGKSEGFTNQKMAQVVVAKIWDTLKHYDIYRKCINLSTCMHTYTYGYVKTNLATTFPHKVGNNFVCNHLKMLQLKAKHNIATNHRMVIKAEQQQREMEVNSI